MKLPRPQFPDWVDLPTWADILVKFLVASALITLSFAVLQLVNLVDAQERGTLCRFEVNADVAGIGDEITAKTSELLIAAAQGNETEIIRLSEELDVLVERLYPAIQVRNQAAERCRR